MAAKFSRRHYEFFAQLIAQIPDPDMRYNMANIISNGFAIDNSRFIRARFFDKINALAPTYHAPSPSRNEFTSYDL